MPRIQQGEGVAVGVRLGALEGRAAEHRGKRLRQKKRPKLRSTATASDPAWYVQRDSCGGVFSSHRIHRLLQHG